MKKVILLLMLSLTLWGCALNNTPTSKVEELMAKYQSVDNDIDKEIEEVLSDDTLTMNQKNDYKELIRDQYRNMSYEIKEEKIDGDKAIVTVAIEVIDYKRAIQEVENEYADRNNYTTSEYNDAKLKKLKNSKEKVTYTLDLDVTKNSDGAWVIDDLSNIDKKKIQGMY